MIQIIRSVFCHSCGGRNPEPIENTGFPFSNIIEMKVAFMERHQIKNGIGWK